MPRPGKLYSPSSSSQDALSLSSPSSLYFPSAQSSRRPPRARSSNSRHTCLSSAQALPPAAAHALAVSPAGRCPRNCTTYCLSSTRPYSPGIPSRPLCVRARTHTSTMSPRASSCAASPSPDHLGDHVHKAETAPRRQVRSFHRSQHVVRWAAVLTVLLLGLGCSPLNAAAAAVRPYAPSQTAMSEVQNLRVPRSTTLTASGTALPTVAVTRRQVADQGGAGDSVVSSGSVSGGVSSASVTSVSLSSPTLSLSPASSSPTNAPSSSPAASSQSTSPSSQSSVLSSQPSSLSSTSLSQSSLSQSSSLASVSLSSSSQSQSQSQTSSSLLSVSSSQSLSSSISSSASSASASSASSASVSASSASVSSSSSGSLSSSVSASSASISASSASASSGSISGTTVSSSGASSAASSATSASASSATPPPSKATSSSISSTAFSTSSALSTSFNHTLPTTSGDIRSSVSSRPVLQPSSPTSSLPSLSPSMKPTISFSPASSSTLLLATSSSSSPSSGHQTTVFTTVVRTSTIVHGTVKSTEIFTTVVPTGSLLPNSSVHGHSNIFAHDPGALAGLIVGVVALVAVLATWAVMFLRRQRLHRWQAETAAAALAGHPGYGSTGARRPPVLADDEDEDEEEMVETFAAPIATGAGSAAYNRLRGGTTEVIDSDGEDIAASSSSPHDPGGGGLGTLPIAAAAAATGGVGEGDALMHPASSSTSNIQTLDDSVVAPVPVYPPGSPRSPIISRKSSRLAGPEPAAWLGGLEVSALAATPDLFKDPDAASPMTTSFYGQSSDEVGPATMGRTSSASDDFAHTTPGGGPYKSSSSSQGHGGGSSSALGHSSSPHPASNSGHGGTGSSSGHGHSDPPRPSSLLPTQTQAPVPPTAYRPVADDDEDDERGSPGILSPRRSFLARPLKWRAGRGPRQSRASTVSGSSYSATPPASPVDLSPSPSTSGLFARTRSLGEVSRLASVPNPAVGPPPARSAGQATPLMPPSISRPRTPVLDALPPTVFVSHATPPTGLTARGVPMWPGLGTIVGSPGTPSPAPTEESGSGRVPEGLLDPRLGVGLAHAMRSQGAISFRDDMDYSRPIGGLVNNRGYSQTTFRTVDTGDSRTTTRRNSHESGHSNVIDLSEM
ncbi:hypothetical protein CERSUDRAFT_112663 [Gelatoporia subvermispora B]|uniref:REJ domain-containing protein n=1 Tax=Ceriporiopsis subvermispora (strain B) TaxID=914234 RepID=M2PQV7_CERS8|nr:hypothetical protein CERSUDRAFT_112663 [Gelatoporia subvermispora B]